MLLNRVEQGKFAVASRNGIITYVEVYCTIVETSMRKGCLHVSAREWEGVYSECYRLRKTPTRGALSPFTKATNVQDHCQPARTPLLLTKNSPCTRTSSSVNGGTGWISAFASAKPQMPVRTCPSGPSPVPKITLAT